MRALEAVDILLRPTMSKFTLIGYQPVRCDSTIWQGEYQYYRPSKSDESEDDENPLQVAILSSIFQIT
jgi:hypothetical protein